MARIVIPQSELPIPDVSDKTNRFRFRVVNGNRNIYSDWSVINYINQDNLRTPEADVLPPITNPGDVLTVTPGNGAWDIGWTPVGTWIQDNNIITEDYNHDLPSGGSNGQVLTKVGSTPYVASWQNAPTGIPSGGTIGQFLVKKSDNPYDVEWITFSGGGGGGGGEITDQIAPDGSIVGGVKTQWTDPNTGYVYNIHTFTYNDLYQWGISTQSLICSVPVIGQLLAVGGGGAGGDGGVFSYGGGGGGGGGVAFGLYAFGTGQHDLYVGKGGKTVGADGETTHFDDWVIPGGGGGGRDGGSGRPGGSGGGGSAGVSGGAPGGSVILGTGMDNSYFYGSEGGYGVYGSAGAGGSADFATAMFGGTIITYGTGALGSQSSPVHGTNGEGDGGQGGSSGGGYGNGGNGIIKARYRIS